VERPLSSPQPHRRLIQRGSISSQSALIKNPAVLLEKKGTYFRHSRKRLRSRPRRTGGASRGKKTRLIGGKTSTTQRYKNVPQQKKESLPPSSTHQKSKEKQQLNEEGKREKGGDFILGGGMLYPGRALLYPWMGKCFNFPLKGKKTVCRVPKRPCGESDQGHGRYVRWSQKGRVCYAKEKSSRGRSGKNWFFV